jgi:hypothetical protein
MFKPKQIALTAVLAVPMIAQAQQNSQPQPVQPTPQTAQTGLAATPTVPQAQLPSWMQAVSLPTQAQSALPAQPDCTPTPPKPPGGGIPKGFHIRVPASIQNAINKKLAQIQDKTGVTVPKVSPDELLKQAQKVPQPCTSIAAAPAPVPPAPPATAKQ